MPSSGAAPIPPEREDHYLLQVSDRRIEISGATPRAALFATYDLLERLGCGWGVPGDDTVPKRSTVSLAAVKVDTTPAFHFRALVDFPMESIPQSKALIDWVAKNRMNWYHPAENALGEPKKWYVWREKLVPEVKKRGLHLNFGGHTMHTWLPPENFEKHPEWFRYKDGIRKAPTLCVTNAEMTAELIRNMQRFLDRFPETEVIDLWHPDGEAFCQCPICTKGTVPEAAKDTIPESTPVDVVHSAYTISYIEFVNRVAAALAKSHPKIMVEALIYGPVENAMPDHCPAPADNVLLSMAHIARDSYMPLAGKPKSALNMRFLSIDLSWMARTKHTYIYEYYNCWVAPYICPAAQTIVRDLQILKELGATGASSDLYGYTPCNMYVAARALWSPDISWEAAVREYHLRYFGDVGQEMADNWVQVEKGMFGKSGWQPGGAFYEPEKRAPSGQYFNDVRPGQIELLEKLIARTGDPQVKARLERALTPWKMWNDKPRWWAFPNFQASN